MTRQDITYQDKLNELRLDISHPNSRGLAFVLLEGDTDVRLFRKFFKLDKCKVEIVPGGNPKLEACVQELLTIYELVIGIRDSDFLKLDSGNYSFPNVFLTDYHDIEMSLVAEDEVFSAIVFEYTDISKEQHSASRTEVINSIETLSYLKWLNSIEDLQINFEPGFQDLISFASQNIDFNQYFQRLLSKSPNAKIKVLSTIEQKIDALRQKKPNPFQLCNGHDFMKAFSKFVREKGKAKSITDETVCSAFRVAFRNEFMFRTSLYGSIKSWATSKNCSFCH